MSDAAITAIVSGVITIVTMVLGFLTLWLKLRYGVEKAEEVNKRSQTVERKIDHNTLLTVQGTQAAADNAKQAATTAVQAKEATKEMNDNISKKLNGGLDSALVEALAPVNVILTRHSNKIKELEDYIHERNHDILTALQTQANKIETIVQLMKVSKSS